MAERVESGDGGRSADLDDLTDVSNVLLLAPSLGSGESDACDDLVTVTPPATTNVLAVSFTRSATEWVSHWNRHVGESPARGGVVDVGGTDAVVEDPSWAVEAVENPSDLTGVGIELSELLSGMAAAADEDEDLVTCFNSVTSLLQYADLQRAFRFLHVVTGRIDTVGAVGHYHLDPEAHDSQTLATLKGLFDAVVEVEDDGTWTVQR
jgi:hypothetical protein